MTRQLAYAYIRKDIASVHLERCEMDTRALAREIGCDLARTIVDGPDGSGMEQLLRLISKPDVDAVVILKSLDHIPDTPLDDLGEFADVLTETPRRRWTKRLTELTIAMTAATRERLRTPAPAISRETATVPVVRQMAAAIDEAGRYRDVAGR